MTPRESVQSLPGLTLRDLTLDVPLDRSDPARGTIEVFARVVTARGGEERPYLVFLQGGPGSEAPRPTLDPVSPPWLERALADYQVVMLDQRGTGRSTPVGLDAPLPEAFTPGDVARAGSPRTLGEASAAQRAEYLTHLRADEIVEDCEAVREALGVGRWSTLGQSFGGFCTLRYLSVHADSLRETYLTGGLSAVGRSADDVYAATWDIMIAKSEAYYRRFPGDRERVSELMALARDGEILLPTGDPVSVDRLRTLGHRLGASGGPEQMHYLLELDHRAPAFRHDLAAALPFAGRNPLYAVIHESSYADGGVTNWSADRTMPDRVREDVTLLGGEHLHRSLFREDPELRPWAETAELLAQHEWNTLYDADALRASDVPGAAAVYAVDAYVPLEFSLETAALLPRLHPWITSQYEHNGLRADGAHVMDRLIGLATGRLAL